jgi:putative ABC transport system permease protein
MTLFSQLRSRLLALLRRSRLERDMDAELRFHLQSFADDLIRAGIPRDEAFRRAHIEFGGFERAKEECRDARGIALLESFLQDLRFGIRTLRKSPAFTAIAILTLALGIGANAAIFGLLDSTLLRALPFRDPDRLVHIWTIGADGDSHTPSPTQYTALQENSASFESIAGIGWADYFYGADESSWQTLSGLVVSPNWLPTLGIQPFLGRNFLEEEQAAGQDAVVMLAYGCWRTRFHADPRIIGKQIIVNRRPVTVIGVLPQSLGPYYEGAEIFAPLVLSAYVNNGILRAGMVRVQITTRLKPGITLDQARSETDVIARQLRHPSSSNDRSGLLIVEPFNEMFQHPGPTVQNAHRGLWFMAAAAGAVLLIACANVASLLLARGVKRQREIALRAALGCSRRRMIRQFLTESTLLFLCGAALGLLIARWAQDIITSAVSGIVSTSTYLEIDARVFAVSFAVSFLSALLFGSIPALSASRVDLNDALKDASPNAAGGSRSRQPRNLLVACQIALGMVLLVGFGLLLRTFLRVESAPQGYDPRNVLTATIRLSPSRYANPLERLLLMRSALDRIRLLPSVEAAGIVDSLPMEGADALPLRIQPPSTNPRASPIEQETWFVSVSPEYFSTLKVPLLAGRPFHDSDADDSPPVVIINQTFAKQYFPGVNPIGYHVAVADPAAQWREIVGVVSDFHQRNPEEDSRPLVYFPITQMLPGRWSMAIRVRSSSDLATVTRSFSNWLRPVDPELYWNLGTMQQQIHDSESLTLRRPIITLLASFGALALLLAIVGVFGVTSYSVAERTREIGIRLALGAARREIAALVLRETVAVALVGLSAGTLAAFLLTRFFPAGPIGWSGSGIYLYGISRTDALTYICSAALLVAVALVACYIPARRAMHLNPIVALRYE